MDFGDWAGRSFDGLDADPEWQRWNAERSQAAAPGGESMAAVQARVMAHLWQAARAFAGRTVAMISHCDVIRAAVAAVLGLSLDFILRFEVAPASVTRIAAGDWGARLLSLNEGVS